MRNVSKSDDRTVGVLAVAGVFGVIGAGAMNVAWGFGFATTIGLFALIASLVAAVLFLGWQDRPAPGTAGVAPAARETPRTVGATATAGGGGTVDLHTPVPEAHADHVSIGGTVDLHTPARDASEADEDASLASSGPGTRPAALEAPRGGSADDLKLIKGIGPGLEKLCNSLGFYHFEQIAAWSDQEVSWVDQNLEGFKGRVTRDAWVAQARVLAAGGSTEFSDRAEKGAAT